MLPAHSGPTTCVLGCTQFSDKQGMLEPLSKEKSWPSQNLRLLDSVTSGNLHILFERLEHEAEKL